jgi:hypothetical protein
MKMNELCLCAALICDPFNRSPPKQRNSVRWCVCIILLFFFLSSLYPDLSYFTVSFLAWSISYVSWKHLDIYSVIIFPFFSQMNSLPHGTVIEPFILLPPGPSGTADLCTQPIYINTQEFFFRSIYNGLASIYNIYIYRSPASYSNRYLSFFYPISLSLFLFPSLLLFRWSKHFCFWSSKMMNGFPTLIYYS